MLPFIHIDEISASFQVYTTFRLSSAINLALEPHLALEESAALMNVSVALLDRNISGPLYERQSSCTRTRINAFA